MYFSVLIRWRGDGGELGCSKKTSADENCLVQNRECGERTKLMWDGEQTPQKGPFFFTPTALMEVALSRGWCEKQWQIQMGTKTMSSQYQIRPYQNEG